MDGKWNDEGVISAETGALVPKHTMNPGAVRVFEKMHADIWNICNNRR